MRKVIKQDLVESVAERVGTSKNVASKMVMVLLDEIKGHFLKGRAVELRGFGTFFPFRRKKRTFRTPRTGEERETPPTTILKFKTSKQLFIQKKPRNKG